MFICTRGVISPVQLYMSDGCLGLGNSLTPVMESIVKATVVLSTVDRPYLGYSTYIEDCSRTQTTSI